MQLTITFSLVRCDCGRERQAARPCPHCGREAEEIDEDLERRRAIASRVSQREPVRDVEPLELDDAFAEGRQWFNRFTAAYEATGEGPVEDAARALHEALQELDVLHARASHARRLRPNHAIWAAIDAVLASYDDICGVYLKALTAPTIEEAEAAVKRGQEVIDSASDSLNRFNNLADAWQRVDSADLADEHGGLLAGAEAVATLSGTSDFLELDRKGARLFNRITGGDTPCPSGFGLLLQLLEFAVDASMDPKRFWNVARNVYERLARHELCLRALFADTEWRADLAAVSLETRDAGFEAAVVTATGPNRRRLIQSALRLAARQIERVAPPLLATLLAVDARRSYTSELRRDINSLLTRAGQAGHEGFLLGLDPKLRDADAHGKFEIEEEGVRLTGSRGKLEFVTDEELVDVVLAGSESLIALYWGLVAALVAAGVDVNELEQAVAAEVADADRIKFVVLLNGWREVDVRFENGNVQVRGERDAPNAFGLISAVVSVVPDDCVAIELVARDDSGTHIASGPADPFRRWSGRDDEREKEIAFTLASMAWTIDGAQILSRAHTEKVYAYRAVEALNPAVTAGEALAALRMLLDAARAIGSIELASRIAAALRLRREVTTGAPLTAKVDDVVEAFDPWLLVDVPEMRSAW